MYRYATFAFSGQSDCFPVLSACILCHTTVHTFIFIVTLPCCHHVTNKCEAEGFFFFHFCFPHWCIWWFEIHFLKNHFKCVKLVKKIVSDTLCCLRGSKFCGITADCWLPGPTAWYINNSRHGQSIFHASYFVLPQSGKILSLISLLFLIWGNNLVSSNPITGDFLPPEWLELKFYCLPEDFDTHTHDVSSNISGHVRSLARNQFLNLSANCALQD